MLSNISRTFGLTKNVLRCLIGLAGPLPHRLQSFLNNQPSEATTTKEQIDFTSVFNL